MSSNNRILISLLLLLWQLIPGLAVAAPTDAATNAVTKEQMDRGSQLYANYCYLCHQPGGQGIPQVFPPLAKSDFLAADKERSIRILITGLNGAITVRSNVYNGVMPPAPYDAQQLSDVLTFVHNSFGNSNGPVTLQQVEKVRAQLSASGFVAEQCPYAPLPPAPEGFTLREVVRMPNHPTRMASDGQGRVLYILCENGDVWHVDLPGGALRRVLSGEDYASPQGGHVTCVGLMLDAQHRLYIVVNYLRELQPYVTDEVTIYRTTAERDGDPAEPRPWLQTSYPWGVGPFNHSVGNIAAGPDGFVYVTSGARTDDNEPGEDTRYSKQGETPITSCFWRLDPRAEKPEIEIFARGVRNPYGFCWNNRGEMFATENGPNADAPEELNQIKRGGHYGFPYQFSNWTNKPYAYTPDAPPGLKITLPIANFGPAAGGSAEKPLFTFDPHSSPGGIVYLGDDFPAGYRGTFLATRFGNLLKCSPDVGFDLLQIKLTKNKAGIYESHVKQLLFPLARPIDVHLAGKGKIYICEYTRVLDNSGLVPMMPGRVLELAVQKKPSFGEAPSTNIQAPEKHQ
ncbi:MAG: Copper oxidase [Pedosphaera sp.]|nr:Copper oxidase [Pedosphaera sp.]